MKKKVLWITNIELPAASAHFGRTPVNTAGWLTQSSRLLAANDQIELHIMGLGHTYDEICVNGIYYSGFCESDDTLQAEKIISGISPDIIHIWGIEYIHARRIVEYSMKAGMIARVIVSIQGFRLYYSYHMLLGLPYDVCRQATPFERLKKISLRQRKDTMHKQGESEAYVIRNVKHCIGRTDWDKACVTQINPSIDYNTCNEILREGFYNNRWSYDGCSKYSIVFSQTYNPIKGLHFMIEALHIIRRSYPQSKLYVLGTSPFAELNLRDRIKDSTYTKYIRSLIERYDLINDIEWMGSLDETHMIEHYLRGNVFVCSSTIENSSNSIGEAMLLGMPVVASDVGGIKSLMEHNKEGIIYQADATYMLAENVMRIFKDPEFAINLGNAAHERAMLTHDPDANTDRLLHIYESIRP